HSLVGPDSTGRCRGGITPRGKLRAFPAPTRLNCDTSYRQLLHACMIRPTASPDPLCHRLPVKEGCTINRVSGCTAIRHDVERHRKFGKVVGIALRPLREFDGAIKL